MGAKIVLFSTTPGMTKRCKEVMSRKNYPNIPIFEMTTIMALDQAQACLNDGARVIISRGGTAEYLQEHLSIPIVDIGHTFLSIYMVIQDLRKHVKNIAMIGYHRACEATIKYNTIMNDQIMVFEVGRDEEFQTQFKKAFQQGAEIILGGFQIANICRENDFPYRSTEPDDSEIEKALHEALHMLNIEEERSRQYSLISTILNSTVEGIIGLDKDGEIFHINRIASKLLNFREPCRINELMPSDRIMQTIVHGMDFYNEIITVNGIELVCGCQAIRSEFGIDGAVVSLQEGNTITSIDSQIRKKLLGRGHIAKTSLNDIIGVSPALVEAKKIAQRYARAGAAILISGETGTGKELFAQGIHNFSNRRNEAFVAVNCAALPQDILESELFGYVRGAFTGARAEGKAGIFELAHKGTVFLDEITEIPLDVQAKLLRVLQEKEVTRIGDDRVIPIDVRIISASNKDLRFEVQEGHFREDLYYRICVLELSLPPLRERTEDIPLLLRHFLHGRKSLTPQAENTMRTYAWPGNIRQLSNMAERLDVLCDNAVIDDDEIHRVLRLPTNLFTDANPVLKDEKLLPQLEARIIKETLQKAGGNRGIAASSLGISTTTLWRRIKEYGL